MTEPLIVHDNEVLLRFPDKAQKEWFMGMVSDGWGEGCCGLSWENQGTYGAFHAAAAFDIRIYPECLND